MEAAEAEVVVVQIKAASIMGMDRAAALVLGISRMAIIQAVMARMEVVVRRSLGRLLHILPKKQGGCGSMHS